MFTISRTLQPADYEPISFTAEGETLEEAYANFNTMQDDILAAFDNLKAATQLKRGGVPPHIKSIALKMPPKGKK